MKIHCSSVHSEKSQTESFQSVSVRHDMNTESLLSEPHYTWIWHHIQSHELMLQLYDYRTNKPNLICHPYLRIWPYENGTIVMICFCIWGDVTSLNENILSKHECCFKLEYFVLIFLPSCFECYFGLYSQQHTIILNNLSETIYLLSINYMLSNCPFWKTIQYINILIAWSLLSFILVYCQSVYYWLQFYYRFWNCIFELF